MRLICALIASLALAGCGSGSSGSPPAGATSRALSSADSAKVDHAAAITNALQGGADPDKTLQAQGMSEQQYQDALYDIAADSAMSAAYNAKVR